MSLNFNNKPSRLTNLIKRFFNKAPKTLGVFFVFAVILTGLLTFTKSATSTTAKTWDFSTASDYTYDNTKIEFSSGQTQLKATTTPAWYNTGWSYRRAITINNTSNSSALTNYQISVALTSSNFSFAKAQSTGQDIRFTDNDGTTLINYWFESYDSSGQTATIYIKVPSIPASSSKTIYLYYGNGSATYNQSGLNTFDLFEDFNGASTAWESVGGGTVGETSLLMSNNGNTCDMWYSGGYSTTKIGYASATDPNCNSWSRYSENPIVSNNQLRGYVIQNSGTYYMFLTDETNTGNIYLYSSTDKTTWAVMNSGNPVYTHSSNPSDWDYHVYNPGVTIINGTWYMLLEGRTGSSSFHTGYAYSDLNELNWSAHRSANYIINNSGNPFLQYVPDRNALLDISGDISTGTWRITCWYASLSDTLSSSASWHACSNFMLSQSGIHLADPTMVVTNNTKNHNIIFQYGYDQSKVYQAYSDLSLDSLYDTMTTGSPAFSFTPDSNNPVFSPLSQLNYTWTLRGSMAVDGAGALDMPSNTQTDSTPSYESSYSGTNYIYEFDAKRTAGSPSRLEPIFAYINDNNYARFFTWDNSSTPFQTKVGGTISGATEMGTNNAVDGSYHKWKIVKTGTSVSLFIDGVQLGTAQSLPSTFNTATKVGLSGYNTAGKWDNVRIRQYTTPEPSTSSGSEVNMYINDNPTVQPTSAQTFTSLSSFTETATKNGGEIKYQISNDEGTTWYWYNSGWVTTTSDYAESNTASDINTNIATFPLGSGSFLFKAYLHSDGSQLVQLDSVVLTYVNDSEAPSIPTVTPSIGTYNTTQSVTLSATGSDYIKYSLTETPATCSAGTSYSDSTPISIASSSTIYVRACDNAGNSSTISFVYVISRPTSSGSSALSRYNNLVAMGKIEAANEIKREFPNQFSSNQISLTPLTQTTSIIPSTPSTPIVLSRIIKLSNTRMWGDDVLSLQTLLNTKGYNVGTPDGNFGPKTQTAVVAFQKANGLTPDGSVGSNTLKYLNGNQTTTTTSTIIQPAVTRILKLSVPRMIGNDVLALQTYLSTNGYDVGALDGVLGNKTKSAIIAFQTANGLTPDGLVGAKTREMMK